MKPLNQERLWTFKEEETSEVKIVGHLGIKLHCTVYKKPEHKRLLIISPGRTESSLKYLEWFYDLKDLGYDIVGIDLTKYKFSLKHFLIVAPGILSSSFMRNRTSFRKSVNFAFHLALAMP